MNVFAASATYKRKRYVIHRRLQSLFCPADRRFMERLRRRLGLRGDGCRAYREWDFRTA